MNGFVLQTLVYIDSDQATNDEDELDIGPLNDLQQLFGRGRRLPRVATSTSLPLETYLPDDLDDFYSFSETPATPDCQQMATWILFSRPISFTTRQVRTIWITRGTNYFISFFIAGKL